MSDGIIKLLIIDPDQIFRTGLRTVIEHFPDLQVVAEAETGVEALQILAELADNAAKSTTGVSSLGVDLVVLELISDRSRPNQLLGLELCRQLKNLYPNLPVFLLSSQQQPSQLVAARDVGVNGYCNKGIPVSELVAAMRQVAAGRSYWVETTALSSEQQAQQIIENDPENVEQAPIIPSIVAIVRDRTRSSGLQYIDATLAEVTAQLQVPGLSVIEQAILAGHRRELLAARWLVNQLLAAPESRIYRVRDTRLPKSTQIRVRRQELGRRDSELTPTANSIPTSAIAQVETNPQISFRTIQSAIFASTLEKLQLSLENLTRVPLEIDILREEKRRELLYLILRKIEDTLDDLRFSQVQPSQLPKMRSLILRDLWQAVTIEFFGRYSTLQVNEENLEIASILLQDTPIVQTAILDQIPLIVDLFSYLLFETQLVIDNVSYSVNSPEALARAEILLQNLLIQVANGVAQPLLNRFADSELIKQNFYDRSLISTREIERFRNNLSWKYRLRNYLDEPKAIFESRYELFVLASRGIARISIYAPRRQELNQLSGIQQAVTLALETRDAIAPRIRAMVAFVGSGVVYVLTQVVGRAIGLIGRGILQGIGSSFPENKNKKF